MQQCIATLQSNGIEMSLVEACIPEIIRPKRDTTPIELTMVDAEIPEKSKRGSSPFGKSVKKEVPSNSWKWMDYLNFFNSLYEDHFGPAPKLTLAAKGKFKSMIEMSVNHYGGETFKKMIEWMFDNYKSYPQWDSVSLSLVCGTHYYAAMIQQKVKATESVVLKEVTW